MNQMKKRKKKSDFKNEIQKEFDYNDDIPASIKEQVDQMLVLTSRGREINGNEFHSFYNKYGNDLYLKSLINIVTNLICSYN